MTRLRSPVAITALIVAVAVSAGVVVDRVSPASARRPPALPAVTHGGVWACPVVALGKLGGYVSVANASVKAATVQVRFVRQSQAAVDFGIKLAPGTAATLKPPAGDAAGAIVQWAGGDVVASRSAATSTLGGRTAAVGAACSRAGEKILAVPGLRTAGADAHVVMLNPSSADAVVDVSFVSDGDEITPESLSSRIVPARGRLDVRVGDFVFDKPELAAVVRVKTGAVAADGLLIAQQGAVIVPATAPRRDGLAVATSAFGARLDLVSLGEDPSTLVGTTLLPGGQHTTQSLPPTVDPLSAIALPFSERGPLGVGLSVRDGSPFVATLGWSVAPRGGGDVAAIPLSAVAKRWLAVTQSPIGSPTATMILANPGPAPVHVRARLLTPHGQVASGELADLTILPGRVGSYSLGNVGTAVGVEVLAVDGEVGFSIIVGGGAREAAFLYAVGGAEARRPARAAVVIDPGAGVPARL